MGLLITKKRLTVAKQGLIIAIKGLKVTKRGSVMVKRCLKGNDNY